MLSIDRELCTDCLDCSAVCPNYVFGVRQGPGSDEELYLRYPDQCCACGHCMAVCPSGALSHPDLPPEGFRPQDRPHISPEAMEGFLLSRRSIRHYRPDPVTDADAETLIRVATHAGSSSNGQSEGFILIRDPAVLRELENLVVEILWRTGFRYLGAGGVMGKMLEWMYGQELMRQYTPYHGIFRHRRQDGEMEGVVFRNAPLVMMAYGLKKNVLAAANCALALRNVELQALTMGLGSCWVGLLVAAAARSRKIGRFLDMAPDTRIGGALMIGYPEERFQLTIPRKPRAVRWI